MRSWGNRADTFVVDEPLYSHYLKVTRLPHPGIDEIIERHESDWRKVAAWLTGPMPHGRQIFYQKHMAHHLLPEIERNWLSRLTHVFLIRDPREMLTSLMKVLPDPRVEDTGLPQQVELFERVQRETGAIPPVFDSKDILDAPEPMLRAMCAAVGVAFDAAMLHWPAGPRETDGVWAKHWYGEVEKSTGFKPFKPKDEPVPDRLRRVYDECRDLYAILDRHKIVVR
jgi:hypothetical protein